MLKLLIFSQIYQLKGHQISTIKVNPFKWSLRTISTTHICKDSIFMVQHMNDLPACLQGCFKWLQDEPPHPLPGVIWKNCIPLLIKTSSCRKNQEVNQAMQKKTAPFRIQCWTTPSWTSCWGIRSVPTGPTLETQQKFLNKKTSKTEVPNP